MTQTTCFKSQEILQGKIPNTGKLNELKNNAEQFICDCIQKGNNNVRKTNGGLLWFLEWSNLQYVTSASFILTSYAQTLSKTRTTIRCPAGLVGPRDLTSFAKSQVSPISLSHFLNFIVYVFHSLDF